MKITADSGRTVYQAFKCDVYLDCEELKETDTFDVSNVEIHYRDLDKGFSENIQIRRFNYNVTNKVTDLLYSDWCKFNEGEYSDFADVWNAIYELDDDEEYFIDDESVIEVSCEADFRIYSEGYFEITNFEIPFAQLG